MQDTAESEFRSKGKKICPTRNRMRPALIKDKCQIAQGLQVMRGADVVSHLADPSSAATHDEHKINSSDALRDPLLVFLPILRQLPGWPKVGFLTLNAINTVQQLRGGWRPSPALRLPTANPAGQRGCISNPNNTHQWHYDKPSFPSR